MNIWFNKNISIVQYLSFKLRKQYKDIFILGSNISTPIYYHVFDKFILEYKIFDVSFYINTILEYKIDYFIPWYHIKDILKHKAFIEKKTGVKILTPIKDINTFLNIDNKFLCYKSLSKYEEILIPEHYLVNNKKDFFASLENLEFQNKKTCFKPTIGIYGSGFKKIEKYDSFKAYKYNKDMFYINKETLKDFFPDAFDIDILLLEYLKGAEYSVDVFAKNGKIISFNIRKKENSKQIIDNENLLIIKQITIIVNHFLIDGFINIQFIENETNLPYLLEINPRFSGGFFKSENLENSNDLISFLELN